MMTAWQIVALVFGSCIFVLCIAAFFFNAGANLVKIHYVEERRNMEEVRPNGYDC